MNDTLFVFWYINVKSTNRINSNDKIKEEIISEYIDVK